MSPRQGPRRPIVGVRIGENALAYIDLLAQRDGLLKSNGEPNRSEMIRALLREAIDARKKSRTSELRRTPRR